MSWPPSFVIKCCCYNPYPAGGPILAPVEKTWPDYSILVPQEAVLDVTFLGGEQITMRGPLATAMARRLDDWFRRGEPEPCPIAFRDLLYIGPPWPVAGNDVY